MIKHWLVILRTVDVKVLEDVQDVDKDGSAAGRGDTVDHVAADSDVHGRNPFSTERKQGNARV